MSLWGKTKDGTARARKRRQALLATVVALGLVGVVAPPAQAFGSNNAIGGLCGGGYAGTSAYYASSVQNYANTTKSNNSCSIGVAIRIYTNAYNRKNTSSTVVETFRSGQAGSGGYHYNGTGSFST